MNQGSSPWSIWALAIIGVLSLVGILGLELERRRSTLEGLMAVRYLGQIRADAAVAHVWVEELLSNDRVDELDLQSRLEALDRALGELGADGTQSMAIPGTPEMGELQGLKRDIQQFQQITEDRLEGHKEGLAVGIGSEFDIIYDRVFNQLLERSHRLEVILDQHRERRESRRVWYFQSLFALAGLTILLALGLYLRREQERRAALQELESTGRQLAHSQKIEVLGRLAGGLAHDINNYLAAIRSQSELLELQLQDFPDEALGQRARLIQGTASRAGALIDRLLTLGSGAPGGNPASDVVALLDTMKPMLESAAPDGVRLRVLMPDDLWSAAVPSASMEQVLLNLVLNGIDALGGRGEVRIEGRNVPKREQPDGRSGDELEIRVSDNGCGIGAQEVASIFEPFWTSKGGMGSSGHAGLGLAVVQSVVTQVSGTIAVESELGVGSTFTLRFPRGPERLPLPAPEEGGSVDDFRGDQRLVVVDDHEELREATVMFLETMGYDVQAAGSLAEADRLLSGRPVDGLVVDLSLGDGDGLDWLHRVRERLGPVPAVVYTGRPDNAQGDRWLERCGAMNIPVVRKGASNRELLAALQRLLAESC